MSQSPGHQGARGGALVCAAALILVAAVAASCVSPQPRARVRRAIVGGTEAPIGAYPETVALMDLSWGDPTSYFCTGTLIAPDLVLSAAHCLFDYHDRRIPDSEIGVYIGHDATNVPLAQVLPVAKSFIPSTYPNDVVADPLTGLGRQDDISILVLAAPVTDVTPTPILPAEQLPAITQGTMMLLVGFGATTLDGTGPDGVMYFGSSPAQTYGDWEMIIGTLGQPDTCWGDSGGPAFLDQGGTRSVVGITSGPTWNATIDCGEAGIYTLAPAYLDWISQTLGVLDGGTVKQDGGQDAAPGEDGGAAPDGGRRDGDGDGAGNPDGGNGNSSGGCSLAGPLTSGQSLPRGTLSLPLLGLLLALLVPRGRVPGHRRRRTPI